MNPDSHLAYFQDKLRCIYGKMENSLPTGFNSDIISAHTGTMNRMQKGSADLPCDSFAY